MSQSQASGSYLSSLRRRLSSRGGITAERAKNMLEDQIDRDKMTRLRDELGSHYNTEKVVEEDGVFTAYAVVHKSGRTMDLPIGEMRDGEWDLHYGFGEFV